MRKLRAIALLALLAFLLKPSQAEAKTDVVPCVAVNTAEFKQGTIEIFYCEPSMGQPYKINSLGFMLNE